MISKHYEKDRRLREKIIQKIGYGEVVDSFIVDRGHKNGPEIHELTDTGIINIYNQRTHKLITKLIANPYQVKRYYRNKPAPQNIVKLATNHTKLGYNWI